jgi:hypothetical protein
VPVGAVRLSVDRAEVVDHILLRQLRQFAPAFIGAWIRQQHELMAGIRGDGLFGNDVTDDGFVARGEINRRKSRIIVVMPELSRMQAKPAGRFSDPSVRFTRPRRVSRSSAIGHWLVDDADFRLLPA